MSASFDAYKIFYYVGKYKNITHAAGALFLSQSTVSRSIQSLEADLGCKLMERSQQGVFLTAEGEMLYRHVARAYEEIMLGEERIKLIRSTSDIRIRLGADNFVFNRFILPILKDFRKDYPNVHIEISSDMISSTQLITENLINDEVDAVFALGPIPDTAGIVSTTLGEYNDVFIAARDYKELCRPNVRIYDLSIQSFISLKHGVSGSEYLRRSFALHSLRVDPAYQVEDFNHLFDLVNMGMGIALVPSPILDKYKYDNIFTINTSASLPRKSLCVLTAKNSPQNPARDELIKRIRKLMQLVLG